uniref:Transposase n=1 Tax=Rathayibacter sp. FH 236 TaxID=2615183 RepID=A0A5J6SIT8_9MICO|nr:transposase [Rathayibacter sp. FH 236]
MDMFAVSPPTICRVYRRIVALIGQACCLSEVAVETALLGRVVLVDDVPYREPRRIGDGRALRGNAIDKDVNVQIVSDVNGMSVLRVRSRSRTLDIKQIYLLHPLSSRKTHRPLEKLTNPRRGPPRTPHRTPELHSHHHPPRIVSTVPARKL